MVGVIGPVKSSRLRLLRRKKAPLSFRTGEKPGLTFLK